MQSPPGTMRCVPTVVCVDRRPQRFRSNWAEQPVFIRQAEEGKRMKDSVDVLYSALNGVFDLKELPTGWTLIGWYRQSTHRRTLATTKFFCVA